MLCVFSSFPGPLYYRLMMLRTSVIAVCYNSRPTISSEYVVTQGPCLFLNAPTPSVIRRTYRQALMLHKNLLHSPTLKLHTEAPLGVKSTTAVDDMPDQPPANSRIGRSAFGHCQIQS